MNVLPASTDVFVIGGGPAGLAACRYNSRRFGFRRAIRAMSGAPRLFEHMLAMHIGELSIPAFLANSLYLGWRMLTV